MMDKRMLVWVGLLLCSCTVASYDDPCDYDQNGCSTKDYNLPYKSTFRPACNKHDVCYACAKVHGFNRKDCDDRFYDDMGRICKNHWFLCDIWQCSYWLVVRIWGGEYYHGNDPKYKCHSAMVNNCMKR